MCATAGVEDSACSREFGGRSLMLNDDDFTLLDEDFSESELNRKVLFAFTSKPVLTGDEELRTLFHRDKNSYHSAQ